VRAEGPLPLLPGPTAAELARARARLDAWPALAREAALARLERTRATEESAARGLRLGVGVLGRRSADGTSAVLGTLSLPLPLWSLGGREVASREAAALRAEHAVTLDRARLAAELELVAHEVAHWDHLEARTREALVPRAEALARARLRQLELGETTVLEALDARRGALAARQSALEAARARAWAHIHARVVIGVLSGEAP
jgi:cobalt-zinc-cadmium efflux system outer membrane protein